MARTARVTMTYRACSIKRPRRYRKQVVAIKEAIRAVLKEDHPQTVRQVFYQLVVRNVIEKTEKEYRGSVIRLLREMRLSGAIPFQWITDSSRSRTNTRTFDSVADALKDTARFYRRSALRESDVHIEIWCEKEALSGLIWDAASDYDVPVVVSKGMPSLSQMFESFQAIHRAAKAGKQSYIYQFADHDPTGALIPEVIERQMDWFCTRADCAPPLVERFALTKKQISKYRLPTRPTKREGNPHAAKFKGDSVELDALPSNILKDLVLQCIEKHIDAGQVDILRTAEESERALLKGWARHAEKGP
jgi:hypothetical protein